MINPIQSEQISTNYYRESNNIELDDKQLENRRVIINEKCQSQIKSNIRELEDLEKLLLSILKKNNMLIPRETKIFCLRLYSEINCGNPYKQEVKLCFLIRMLEGENLELVVCESELNLENFRLRNPRALISKKGCFNLRGFPKEKIDHGITWTRLVPKYELCELITEIPEGMTEIQKDVFCLDYILQHESDRFKNTEYLSITPQFKEMISKVLKIKYCEIKVDGFSKICSIKKIISDLSKDGKYALPVNGFVRWILPNSLDDFIKKNAKKILSICESLDLINNNKLNHYDLEKELMKVNSICVENKGLLDELVANGKEVLPLSGFFKNYIDSNNDKEIKVHANKFIKQCESISTVIKRIRSDFCKNDGDIPSELDSKVTYYWNQLFSFNSIIRNGYVYKYQINRNKYIFPKYCRQNSFSTRCNSSSEFNYFANISEKLKYTDQGFIDISCKNISDTISENKTTVHFTTRAQYLPLPTPLMTSKSPVTKVQFLNSTSEFPIFKTNITDEVDSDKTEVLGTYSFNFCYGITTGLSIILTLIPTLISEYYCLRYKNSDLSSMIKSLLKIISATCLTLSPANIFFGGNRSYSQLLSLVGCLFLLTQSLISLVETIKLRRIQKASFSCNRLIAQDYCYKNMTYDSMANVLSTLNKSVTQVIFGICHITELLKFSFPAQIQSVLYLFTFLGMCNKVNTSAFKYYKLGDEFKNKDQKQLNIIYCLYTLLSQLTQDKITILVSNLKEEHIFSPQFGARKLNDNQEKLFFYILFECLREVCAIESEDLLNANDAITNIYDYKFDLANVHLKYLQNRELKIFLEAISKARSSDKCFLFKQRGLCFANNVYNNCIALTIKLLVLVENTYQNEGEDCFFDANDDLEEFLLIVHKYRLNSAHQSTFIEMNRLFDENQELECNNKVIDNEESDVSCSQTYIHNEYLGVLSKLELQQLNSSNDACRRNRSQQ